MSVGNISNREKLLLSTALITILGLVLLSQVLRTTDRGRAFTREFRIFSTSVPLNVDIPTRHLVDRDIRTAWADQLSPAFLLGANRFRPIPNPAGPLPDPRSLYINMELGVTHYPAYPPRINPLNSLLIWPGDQGSPERFRSYARPRRVRLVFFRQQLVDPDRSYRFPDLPRFWGMRVVTLKDAPGVQRIPLDFLTPIEPSPGFPRNVSRIWLRLIFESYYPGTGFPARVAVSEIDFRQTFPMHIQVPVDNEGAGAKTGVTAGSTTGANKGR